MPGSMNNNFGSTDRNYTVYRTTEIFYFIPDYNIFMLLGGVGGGGGWGVKGAFLRGLGIWGWVCCFGFNPALRDSAWTVSDPVRRYLEKTKQL